MKLKELRAKLAKVAKDMRDMHAAAEKEDRGFTAEELETWNKLDADYVALEARVQQAERMEKLEAPTRSGLPTFETDPNDPAADPEVRTALQGRKTDEYREAYDRFLRNGAHELTAEQRAVLQRYQAEMEIRAQGIATGAAGGFTVPEGFAGFITETMKDFSGLFGAASGSGGPTMLRTTSGATIPFPTNDDTGNTGAILTENNQVTEQDTVFGARNLTAFMYTSKLIRVSLQLLQDEAVNLEQYLGNILGKRLGRALSPHFARGAGTTEPTGLVTAATDAAVDISAAAGVTYNDLVDFEHALDPAYRRRGAKWVFNDNTLKGLKKLVDGNNRPLWLPADVASIERGGAGPTLLGYGYVIDQGLQNVGVGARPIAFGDLSEFYIREVLGVNMFRFSERYMDFLQIGFMAYARYDSNLIDTAAVVTDIVVA